MNATPISGRSSSPRGYARGRQEVSSQLLRTLVGGGMKYDGASGVRDAAADATRQPKRGFGCMAGTAREVGDIIAPLPPEDWEVLR